MHDVASAKGRDLWGPDFQETPVESAPFVLLKEQADALTQRTRGDVRGDVAQEVDKGTVWSSLYALVPALGDYRHKLISIAHPVTADPKHPFPLTVFDTLSTGEDEVHDMDSFERWLADVLSSAPVHQVIDNLLRYSRSRAAS
jgi:hypothetical protein